MPLELALRHHGDFLFDLGKQTTRMKTHLYFHRVVRTCTTQNVIHHVCVRVCKSYMIR